MIAKRVPRGKAGNFKRLGRYIVGGASVAVSGQPLQAMPGEPASQAQPGEAEVWTRTAEYIVDAAGGGARTAAVRISNCAASDVEMAIAEILATQSKNVRAKGDRTYHLVVAFPPGEKPALEQLRDIEDELCKAIGFAKHQRLSAVHIDTEHLHLHVAINQVHPETLCLIEPWQDRHKLMRACDRLEIKHGLTRTNHGKKRGVQHARSVSAMDAADGPKIAGVPQEPLPARAQAMERHSGEISLLSWIRREVRPNLEATLANVTS